MVSQQPSESMANTKPKRMATLSLHNKLLAPGDLTRRLLVNPKQHQQQQQTPPPYHHPQIPPRQQPQTPPPESWALQHLQLDYCYVDYMKKRTHETKLFAEFLEILRDNVSTLETLQIKTLGNFFPRNAQQMEMLLQVLQSCQKLKSLTLAVPDDALIAPSGQVWRDWTQSNVYKTLQHLHLEGFDLTDVKGCIEEALVPSLLMPQEDKKMDKANSDKDSKEQESSTPPAIFLRHLNLGGCRITDKGLWKLVNGLQHLKTLEKLQLPGVPTLTPISLLTMASIMQNTSHLHLLDLTNNPALFAASLLEEDDEEEDDIMFQLHPNKNHKRRSRRKIYTGQDPTGDGSTPTGLPKKTRDIRDPYLQREHAMTAFMKALQTNLTVTELRLSHCGLVDLDFKFLLTALQDNRKLSKLHLDFNHITRKTGLEHNLPHQLPHFRALAFLSLRGLQRKVTDEISGRVIYEEDSRSAWQTPQSLEKFRYALEQNNSLEVLLLGSESNGQDPNHDDYEDFDEDDRESQMHPTTIQDLLDRNATLKKLHKFNPTLAKAKMTSAQKSTTTTTTASSSNNKTSPLVQNVLMQKNQHSKSHHHKSSKSPAGFRFQSVMAPKAAKYGDPPAAALG